MPPSDPDSSEESAPTTDADGATEESSSDRSDGAPRTVREERTLDRMRQTIADRLQDSYQNAVHVTVSREIDAEALLTATDTATDRLDTTVSVPDLVLLALSETLAAHPGFNATFEDGTHRLYEEHNVGIAVDIDAGLVTPVLSAVETRSLADLATERRAITERVQAGEYTMSDLRGGTFTVTNLGPLDVDSFTPIINPPEVAILGLNRLRERAEPGEDGPEFRRRLNVDLSFDHRVVDGADASRFLGTLAEQLQVAETFVPDS